MHQRQKSQELEWGIILKMEEENKENGKPSEEEKETEEEKVTE